MKVKFFIDLNEGTWDYNLDCAEGRRNLSLLASTTQYSKMDGYERIQIEVDLPNRFFTPPRVDNHTIGKVVVDA